jgi:hypothetical protein
MWGDWISVTALQSNGRLKGTSFARKRVEKPCCGKGESRNSDKSEWELKQNHECMLHVQYNLGNPTYMGPRYSRITENDGLLEKVGTNLLLFLYFFPDIVYRCTSNTILFSQINKFSFLSSFLIIYALALKVLCLRLLELYIFSTH